ncbi:hypothetical protein [Nonomuraea sp. NPDC049646]|uniref:hypothetical protein n=1 Tax=unclassified Nonomuraea TaxID=2593643 RepID=UPI00379EAB14
MGADSLVGVVLAAACGVSWTAAVLSARGGAVLDGWHLLVTGAPGGERRRSRSRGLGIALHPVTALVAVTLFAALIVGYHAGSFLALYAAGCS